MKRFITIALSLVLSVILMQGCGNMESKKGTSTNDLVKMSVTKENWGKADGKEVFLYTLKNRNGIVVKISNYGGIITSILVADAKGKTGDIVLGYDSLKGYFTETPYFGAIVGRYANRIAKGTFILEGKRYHLAINNGNNTLHGGIKGFDKVVWDASEVSDSSGVGLNLTYFSRDGEEGYPGNLNVTVTYMLTDANMLKIEIEATTDKPTPVNLCNHTYFNLREADTNILGHLLKIDADRYTVVNDELIPTGELRPVEGTPMDFRTLQVIGSRIGKVNGGYDHNYVVVKKESGMSPVATIEEPVSGRIVEISSTQPGVQFYSGNFLDGTIKGKGGKIYRQHYGLCLETQHFPDSPNQPSFPNTILRPGEKFKEVTVYRFGVSESHRVTE